MFSFMKREMEKKEGKNCLEFHFLTSRSAPRSRLITFWEHHNAKEKTEAKSVLDM